MSNIFNVPLQATLVRRLAEAADGFRNVNQVFFIAGYQPPHPIKDFPDLTSAQSYFSENGFSENDYGIFGPFKTTDDVENLNLPGVENIDTVDLAIHFKDGTQQDICLPGGIDSIFFNLSSFEKFVFPYYCHLYGVEYAKTMRDNLIAKYSQQTDQSNRILTVMPHVGATLMYKLIPGEDLSSEEVTY
jgi:hypothetical protein